MTKIVIHVNTDSLADANLTQPREIIEYRWDRIIAAVVLLCLLIGGISWAVVRALSSPPHIPTSQAALAETSPLSVEPEPTPALTQSTDTIEELPADLPAAASTASTEPQALDAPTHKPKASLTPESTEDPTPQVDQQPAKVSATEPTVAKIEPAEVRTLTNHIRRAQLTSDVVNREPVDQLPSTIVMNEEGLLRIYLFTETVGLEGRTLYHHWYLNGKQMARVQLPGLKHPVALSSSKFIDRHMTGTWTVKIIDDRNMLLAETEFEVRP